MTVTVDFVMGLFSFHEKKLIVDLESTDGTTQNKAYWILPNTVAMGLTGSLRIQCLRQ
jgi:hypothetical protein